MATSENAEELEVAVELQGKSKLIDPPASLRSAVWKSMERLTNRNLFVKYALQVLTVSYKIGTTSNMRVH